MIRLGLVTLELMLSDLKKPIFAGDVPVGMDLTDMRYESTYADEYEYSEAGPGDDGCGGSGGECGCGGGCSSGGGDCGGCGHEMMASMPIEGPSDDPVGDRDRTRDRSPRPDRKRLPWDIGPGLAS